jgi:predicted methyltransferase
VARVARGQHSHPTAGRGVEPVTVYYTDDAVTLHEGDCLDVLPTLADASVDCIVTSPPYFLTTRLRTRWAARA